MLNSSKESIGHGLGVFVLHIWLGLESGGDRPPIHLFNLSQCLATLTVKDSHYLFSSSADLF